MSGGDHNNEEHASERGRVERMARVACNVWHGDIVWHRVGKDERDRWRRSITAARTADRGEVSS